MNTASVHDWRDVWEKLGKDLPGLTDTDLYFVQDCAAEIVNHLMMRTNRKREEVEAAMVKAGLPVPKWSPRDTAKRRQSSELQKGRVGIDGGEEAEGELPPEYCDASGIPENTSQSGTSALSI